MKTSPFGKDMFSRLLRPSAITLLLVFFVTMPFFAPLKAVASIQASPSSESSPSSGIDEKSEEIEKIRDEVKKAVEEKLKEIVGKETKRAWLGIIKSKDETSLKIENSQGQLLEVSYDEETVIVDSKRKNYKISDLTIGKRVLVMGYTQSENILEAKRVIILGPAETRKTAVIKGTISDKSVQENLVVVTSYKNSDYLAEILVDDATKIILPDEKAGSYSNLKTGQKAIVVYNREEKLPGTAKIIKILN